MGTTSSVALRTAREFGDYKLDNVIDMANVVLKDGVFHFYNLPPEQESLIKGVDFHTCCLQINSPAVRSLALTKEFHQEPLDVAQVCNSTEACYHLDNVWHLLLDNVMAQVANIITTPNCKGQLPCRQKSVLFRFPDINPKGEPLPWNEVFARLFSQGSAPASTIMAGIKPIYQDYVDLKRETFTVFRDWLMEEYDLRSTRGGNEAALVLVGDEEADRLGVLEAGYLDRRLEAGIPIKALYIHRAPQPNRNRHFKDYSPILQSFDKFGVQVKVIDDFSQPIRDQLRNYIDSDIIIGLHGAGLTNCMFSRKGVVVVEYKSAYGSAEANRKIAQGRYGGYMQVPLWTPADDGYHTIPEGLSDKVAACTIGMVNGDMAACREYHGYLYSLEKGHRQDCKWSATGCLPLVTGLHYIKPLQPGQTPVPYPLVPPI